MAAGYVAEWHGKGPKSSFGQATPRAPQPGYEVSELHVRRPVTLHALQADLAQTAFLHGTA